MAGADPEAAAAIWRNVATVWLLNPAAIVEAAEIARDPGYRVPDNAEVALLKKYAILDANGRMHDIDREIVLAAAIEAATEFSLAWPFARKSPE